MICVFDVETTGLINPEVVQAGYVQYSNTYGIVDTKEKLFRPSKPIEWEAMGLHGVTNEMVNGKKPWNNRNFIPSETIYLVCHNATFDTQFIDPEVLSGVKVICTLKLAKKLIGKHESGNHKNSTLYYYLGCYKDPIGKEYLGKTHTAVSDCVTTLNVLLTILDKYNLTIDQAYAMIMNIDDSNPVLEDITICPFKKYSGQLWATVVKNDKDYCQWLLDSGKIKNPAMAELVRGWL